MRESKLSSLLREVLCCNCAWTEFVNLTGNSFGFKKSFKRVLTCDGVSFSLGDPVRLTDVKSSN